MTLGMKERVYCRYEGEYILRHLEGTRLNQAVREGHRAFIILFGLELTFYGARVAQIFLHQASECWNCGFILEISVRIIENAYLMLFVPNKKQVFSKGKRSACTELVEMVCAHEPC